MIFRDGFYHADPHPGNILVLAKGRVGILDGGMVGRIDDELRERIVETSCAAADRDAPRLADIIAVICKAPTNLDRGGLERRPDGSVRSVRHAVGRSVRRRRAAHRRHSHHARIQPLHAQPALDADQVPDHPRGDRQGAQRRVSIWLELFEPYRRQFVLQQFSPETWLRKARHVRRDWELLAESIPRSFNNLLEQLQSGDFAVRIKHPPLETSVNRLVYGLCTSALLLASALLWIHEVPPTIHGVLHPRRRGLPGRRLPCDPGFVGNPVGTQARLSSTRPPDVPTTSQPLTLRTSAACLECLPIRFA